MIRAPHRSTDGAPDPSVTGDRTGTPRFPRSRAALGAVGLVGAAALVLSGCSASAPAPGDGSDADGTLTVGSANSIPQLNPAIRTFAFEETLFPLLWTGLTAWDPAGSLQSDLATEWTPNDDATVWTFTLTEGATYSDGTPLDADAVVAVFDYYLDPDTATQEANKLATIDTVTAVDETTVEFSLSEANAFLPESLTGVRMIDVASMADINSEPVTSGPFVVDAFAPDDALTLVPNDAYWGTPPALDAIEIVTAADPTAAVTSLRSGDLDVLIGLAYSDVTSLDGESAVSLVTPEVVSQAVTWELDTTSAPFDDADARRALAYATDRETILQTAYYGQGVVSETNTMLAADNPFHSDDLATYPYDLDRAAELFEAAGVGEGDTLTWWSASAFPEWQAAGQILQASLAEIGITLEIQANDTATWAARFYPAGQTYPGLIVPNFQSVPASPAFSMNFLLSGRCECNWNDADFDQAFASALATTDPAEQQTFWDEAQARENQDVPLITPVIVAPSAATQTGVGGVWIEGGGQVHLETAHLD